MYVECQEGVGWELEFAFLLTERMGWTSWDWDLGMKSKLGLGFLSTSILRIFLLSLGLECFIISGLAIGISNPPSKLSMSVTFA